MCRMHCQTYAPTLTIQQPFNNLIRSTIYAMAAIMGGVQSLHVNSFDEALAIPTEFAAALSVRTQQIIDVETDITKVIDPLGGSYYVEWLTNKLEEEAIQLIDKIQGIGGAFKAWDWMCLEIRNAAMENQQEYDSSKRMLVGVNTLIDEKDIQMEALKVLQQHAHFDVIQEYDPSYVDKQIKRLNRSRKERDPEKLTHSTNALIETMRSKQNMMPSLIDAVKCGMTRGEFATIKADVFQRPAEGPYGCSPPFSLA